MKFMAFMIPGVYQGGKKLDPKWTPDPEKMKKMGEFNEQLGKACKILALDGLHPLDKGARVSYSGGKAQVTDGPYIEAKEVVGGYWMIEAKSKEEVVNWMKRCPAEPEDVIEIRQVFDLSDFPLEVQQGAQKGVRR